MDYRHVTPPSDDDIDDYQDIQCPGGSASTNASFLRQDWSPGTVMTAATTPPRSPFIIREPGSRLLPKPRDQDQVMEPATASSAFLGHTRTSSLPGHAYFMQFGTALPQPPAPDRRSTSPRGRSLIVSSVPTPTPSPHDHLRVDMIPAHRPSVGNARSVSASHISSVRSHSRNASSSSIDGALLSRYGYPTYRQSPTPQPMGRPMSRTPSAMNHLAPIAMPGGHFQNYPNSSNINARRTASPQANPSRLSMEVEATPEEDLATSTVLEYLTAPNPTPSLIQRSYEANKSQNSHFWFDIRNIRAWSDFNVSSIAAVPQLLTLLKIDVSLSCLPTPAKVNLNPETPSHLAELCATHHAVKVNAALKIAQGSKHIAMRTLHPTTPGPSSGAAGQQPEFIANYQLDSETTIHGSGRGRVVGIVKSYDAWNSSYRHGSPVDKIRYLEHLAHLHRCMREHGTRYGFLLTEIELVCVRSGGPEAADDNVPLFGYLELSAPIQVSTSGMASSSAPSENGGSAGGSGLKLTVGLALWYLHMLAKEVPFAGQLHWRTEPGGPAALTRRKHLPRDEWMPKVNLQDKRGSKRVRGWVWPNEPLHKRECARGRTKAR